MMHEIICLKGHISLTSHIEQTHCTICARIIVKRDGKSVNPGMNRKILVEKETSYERNMERFSILKKRINKCQNKINEYNRRINWFADQIQKTFNEMEEVKKIIEKENG